MKVAGAQNQALIAKYGVICKRFTSLDEALKTPEIACTLDLSNQNLSSLSDEISELTNLKELDLSNNLFTEFPSELYSLKKLVSIDISSNNLNYVPSIVMDNLPMLSKLLLEDNKLTAAEIEKYIRITPTPLPKSIR